VLGTPGSGFGFRFLTLQSEETTLELIDPHRAPMPASLDRLVVVDTNLDPGGLMRVVRLIHR
jgi:hypothetical protein